jgi:O-acetylhomoserine (thiol)-lyase
MLPDTAAVHAGYDMDKETRAIAVPIYQTVSYGFESADHAADLFNLQAEGHRYARISNPTTSVLERRIAVLEGGLDALCVSSGQTAVYFAIMNLVEAGRNIVTCSQLYGTTHTLFSHMLPSVGVEARFAESSDPAAIEAMIDHNTRAIYCESISNPSGDVADISALAELAHRFGMPLVVDNTVATPMLLRPLEHGADIVVHSMTKFLGGHGTTLGGVIVDSGNFPWARHPDRYPMFSRPDLSYHGLVYHERFGRHAYLGRCRSTYLRVIGATLSPLSAFLLLQGIETLAVRIDRHVANGEKIAKYLAEDPRVEWISYLGFADHPSHALLLKQCSGRAPSLLTFSVKGGYAAGVRFYDALKLVCRVVNLGDAKSLACHPASTTHRQMTHEEQLKAGITPSTIRLSIGIEHPDDIIADLHQALSNACETAFQERTATAGVSS